MSLPAVGENKRLLFGVWVLWPTKEWRPLVPSFSIDIVDPATCRYTPDLRVGCRRAVESVWLCSAAARRTERLIDQATKTRQANTDKPNKPRAAPTAMKIVPSGRFDFCLYGALAVDGTAGVGIVKPLGSGGRLGRPERPGRSALVLSLFLEPEELEVLVVSPGRLSVG